MLRAAVVWVSPSLEDAIGWTPEEWIGTPLETFIHPDDMTVFEDDRLAIWGQSAGRFPLSHPGERLELPLDRVPRVWLLRCRWSP